MEEQAEVERLRQAQRIINDYHRTFETESGKRVLDDLSKQFGLTSPVFVPVSAGDHNRYDPLTAALQDGARRVVIHINTRLAAPAKADDEIQKKERVKK